MTNGTTTDATVSDEQSSTPDGHEQFTVADVTNENAFHFDNRPDADDKLEKAQNAPGVDPELFPPGESPDFLQNGEVADEGDEETEVDDQEGREQKDEDDEVTEPLSDDVEVVKADSEPDSDKNESDGGPSLMVSVTYTPEGDPTTIKGVVEPKEHAPVFEMEGSTAVFIGPAFAHRVEAAADAVEQLDFVQAVSMGENHE